MAPAGYAPIDDRRHMIRAARYFGILVVVSGEVTPSTW